MEQLGSHWTDFSWNLTFEYFLKNYPENSSFIKIGQELRVLYMKTNIHFWSSLAQFFLEKDMFHSKNVGEIKTQILCAIIFFNRAVYETMWWNIVKQGRPQMTIWRMRVACWIHNATDTQAEYVIQTAFPLQQRLHERPSMLRSTYIACLVHL
jgi:hypothetical protein